MSAFLLVFSVLVLATALAASGLLKLTDADGVEAAMRCTGVVPPRLDRFVRPAAVLLPPVEILLGLGLVFSTGALLRVVALAAVGLLVVFVILLACLLARGSEIGHHCFGSTESEPVTWADIVRTAGLAVLGLVVATLARSHGGVGPVLAAADHAEAALPLLGAAGLLAVTRLVTRVRRLTRALKSFGGARAAEPRTGPTDIPGIMVVDPDGRSTRLADLSADRAQLVLAVSPGCSASRELLSVVARWRAVLGEEVGIVLMTRSSRAAASAAFPDHVDRIVVDPSGKALRALEVAGTPAAVLLGTNGTVAAGPALGGEQIGSLVSVVVQAIRVNVMCGTAHRPAGGSRADVPDGRSVDPASDHRVVALASDHRVVALASDHRVEDLSVRDAAAREEPIPAVLVGSVLRLPSEPRTWRLSGAVRSPSAT